MNVALRHHDLELRAYTPSDASELLHAARESTTEVHPWLPWCHPGYTLAEAEAFITRARANWQEGAEYHFAVLDPTGRLLGGCGLNHLNAVHRFANLGYWLRTSATGRGIAPRAAALVAGFAFAELALARIEIVIDPDNTRSLRDAQRLGDRREGVLRERLWSHGRSRPAEMWSLVPDDSGPADLLAGAPR